MSELSFNEFFGNGQPTHGDMEAIYAELAAIRERTDLLSEDNTPAIVLPPVHNSQITIPLFIGADYKAERAFIWPVEKPLGVTVVSCLLAFKHESNGDPTLQATGFQVSGAVENIDSETLGLKYEIPRTASAALIPGRYVWNLEMVTSSGDVIVPTYNAQNNKALWLKKNTAAV